MLINQSTAISTSKILLVPYSKHHVPTYHGWMQDEELQNATASEPLTLIEEHSMQQTWRIDADKLTFISCMPVKAVHGSIITTKHDAIDHMLGDVNLFLTDSDDEDAPGVIGEVELMIASKQHQGRGYGRASLLAFLKYIVAHEQEILQQYAGDVAPLGKNLSGASSQFMYLRVKIGESNHRSIGLFESLGFVKVGEANYFGEVELRLVGDCRAAVEASWRRYADVGDYHELHCEGGD